MNEWTNRWRQTDVEVEKVVVVLNEHISKIVVYKIILQQSNHDFISNIAKTDRL